MSKLLNEVIMSLAVSANATGTLSYQVPMTEFLEVVGIRQQSTGIFNVTGIRDSTGTYFSNASEAVGIPEGFFADTANEFHANEKFVTPMIIEGGATFFLDIKDTSGSSNTIKVLLDCIRYTGGDKPTK